MPIVDKADLSAADRHWRKDRALPPESCGFVTSGSSGGLEKGSMRRASKAHLLERPDPSWLESVALLSD